MFLILPVPPFDVNQTSVANVYWSGERPITTAISLREDRECMSFVHVSGITPAQSYV